ncbi:MAG: aldose 1-epimerase family protein [Marinilabiliales bacterium]|nr:aldose 1-epimerase family protein [Marinilabiliales bacterium]
MKHFAKNEFLEIAVRQPGAEICSIKSLKTGLEYMWSGDPAVWNSTAPILFPIVGGLLDNTYQWKGETYRLNKHGFIRDNPQLQLRGITLDSLTFGMSATKETLKVYPFDFDFEIKFELDGPQVKIHHTISNPSDTDLLFSVGGHPGFKCPRHENESYEDYYLEFDQPESSRTWLLHENGTLLDETAPVFHHPQTIPVTHDLFSKDALVFKDLKSTKISLKSHKSPQSLFVSFPGFPFMGIWAKPNGDYVCIEPWYGIADKWDTDQDLRKKEGILVLPAGETFRATYSIGISE